MHVCLSRPQWVKKTSWTDKWGNFILLGVVCDRVSRGHFHAWSFTGYLDSNEIPFYLILIVAKMITTKFCTCHNSCAVKASAEFWNDTIVRSWNTIHCWFITLNFEWKKCPWNSFLGWVVKEPPGSAFIKPDQRNPWIKDQIKITLLPTISHLLLPNFVSCGRACPSHMTQNLVTVGAKLWTADRFIVDPWSMDYADPVW